MSTLEAKRAVRRVLKQHGLTNRVSARRVVFNDLARTERVFVFVHGWTPNPLADTIKQVPGVIVTFTREP